MIEMITSDRVLKRWLFKAVIGALIGLFAFHQRHAISNHFMEMRLDAVSQFQQRIAQPPAPARAPARTPEQVEAERAATQRRAEEYAATQAEFRKAQQEADRKDRAWHSFFQETQRCLLPESQGVREVCQAREARLRSEFETRWSRGEWPGDGSEPRITRS